MSDKILPPLAPELPDSYHDGIAALFLGPHAENFKYFHDFINTTIKNHESSRASDYPDDPASITESMQGTALFNYKIKKLEAEHEVIMKLLAKNSVPFWSPRYNAHMSMDTTLAGNIGYFTTMLYNQNNVTTEASPFTTMVEKTVGTQLCKMLGYNLPPTPGKQVRVTTPAEPVGWGHITSGGSVANLESIWAARNLKFYPLSLKLAIAEGSLGFLLSIQPPFEVEICNGEKKEFAACTVWELLNLKPSTVLDLPRQLYAAYGISQSFLQDSLYPYSIQTVGKDYLENYFGIKKPAQIYISTTKHYSWPKGGAIAGIGSENVVDVSVDVNARMDIADLEEKLEACIKPQIGADRRAVFAVVAIIGSTEQGAVDPLREILLLRSKYEQKGLTFVVHCDAAWGGYFASMLVRGLWPKWPSSFFDNDDSYVPELALKPYTRTQLESYKHADSITIDPHKSGYIPYPAGGLCYRDERMRYLVTWTSPIVFHSNDQLESMGVYGVEGSKPGAAPVAAYLSHMAIGLGPLGYGALLGEATFTCTRLYAHWCTMPADEKTSDLILEPLNMLPTEAAGGTPGEIEKQKKFIRDEILNKENCQLSKEAMKLLGELGSDLMINAFACNFKLAGKPNEDIVEANHLNSRIFERFSMQKVKGPGDNSPKPPLILTSTSLSQKGYGKCLDNFKRRLHLKGKEDLFVLVNVTMSPWSTTTDLLKRVTDAFEVVANEEIEGCKMRNTVVPSLHGFVMQGTDKVHLVHLPMFHMANHRYQLIITGDLPAEVMEKYKAAKENNPGQFYTLGTAKKEKLSDFAYEGGSLEAVIDEGFPGGKRIAEGFILTNIHVVKKDSLAGRVLDSTYPKHMPFYLYGTPEQQHIDHLLNVSPNIQLNSDRVTLSSLSRALTPKELADGVVATFTDVREYSLQPLSEVKIEDNREFVSGGFRFLPKTEFSISVFKNYRDSQNPRALPLARGKLTLGSSVFAENEELNMFVHPKAPHHDTATEDSEAQVTRDSKTHEDHFTPTGASLERKKRNQHVILEGWQREWDGARARAYEQAELDLAE